MDDAPKESYGITITDLPRYAKVLTLGSLYTENALKGEVIVQEKIDGSQFRFGFRDDGEFLMGTRKTQLFFKDQDGMFKEAIEYLESIEKKMRKEFQPGDFFFAEYLQKPKHNTLKYDRFPKNHLILFDALIGGQWITDRKLLEKIARNLGVEIVPEIFRGTIEMTHDKDTGLKFMPQKGDWEDWFKQESILGGETIEGVVIKNYDQHIEIYGSISPLITKVVREEFKERHSKNPDHKPQKQSIDAYLMSYKSEARWEKAIQHLAEEGKLETSPRDIGALIKAIQNDIEEECKEDIKEFLYKNYKRNLMALSVRGFPEFYKNRLMERLNEGTSSRQNKKASKRTGKRDNKK